MDDAKLLSLTRIRLNKDTKKKKKVNVLTSRDSSNITMFGGVHEVLPSEKIQSDLYSTLPLSGKSIPKHLFDHKKAALPKPEHARKRLHPDKDIQEVLAFQYGIKPLSTTLSFSRYEQSRSADQLSGQAFRQDLGTQLGSGEVQTRLLQLQNDIHNEQTSLIGAERNERLKALHTAERYVNKMPLGYLFAKPELRHFAIQRCYFVFYRLAEKKAHGCITQAMRRWKRFEPESMAHTQLNEKQIGFLSIAKRLDRLIKRKLRQHFMQWAFTYCTKFDSIRLKKFNDAAFLIQDWYTNIKIIRKQPFRDFFNVIRMCLHRRRAIHYMLKFEQARRQALNKMRRAVATRRRYHFAARTIQRIMRWLMLYRQTKWMLVRSINARRLQRWRRRMLKRPWKELMLIRLGLRVGAYTRVNSMIPDMYRNPVSLLSSMEDVISGIQRWYMSRMGKMDLFLKLAERRRRAEYEAKINKAAGVIQKGYRFHLGNELMRAAVLNNRARRVQRGLRSFVYRRAAWLAAQRLRVRKCKILQRFARHIGWISKLRAQFEVRKLKIACERIRRVALVRKLQTNYREHVVYAAMKKEEMRLFFASQRLKSDVVLNSVRRIQMEFRNFRRPHSMLCRHVRLYAQNMVNKERYNIWKMAVILQKVARTFVARLRARMHQLRVDSANKIWRLAKSYLLKKVINHLVEETRKRRNAAAKRIQHNYRMFTWLRKLFERFAVMKARIELERLRNRSATAIQHLVRRKNYEYYLPVRLAARGQLRRRRKERRNAALLALRNHSAIIIQRLCRNNASWMRFSRTVHKIKVSLIQRRAAKKIQKLIRAYLATARVNRCVRERLRRNREELKRQQQQWAANVIGRNWRRSRELFTLNALFRLRRRMLDEYKQLEDNRMKAEADRAEALEDVRVTEENMQATILASWKQGSDTNGRNYYYNFVTGESRWDPPENWTLKVTDAWIRNINERGQVYYYNQQTEESRWLPPCCCCGKEAERWCSECCAAYCVEDYVNIHNPETDEDMASHTWSAAELSKDVLKAGQVYCIECKKRAATKVCLTCWDNYCSECFKFVHHVGDLRNHETIGYRRAKQGWNTVKPKDKTSRVYYVNGLTGETTFEKPRDLMTPSEMEYFDNFVSHRQAAESYVTRIDELQNEVETLKYERDMRLANEIGGRGGGGIRRDKKVNDKGAKGGDDVMNSMKNAKRGPLAFLSGLSQAYTAKLMQPDDRKRGHKRSEYIKGLLEGQEEQK